MKIKEINRLAFAIWGTKRGKKLFLQSNIDEDENTIDDELNDIRGVIGFKKIGSQFYSIEYKTDYTNLTIYRTIYDWLGRLGFYAVSICIPTEKSISCSICKILDDLSEIYHKEYIEKTDEIAINRIRADKQEELNEFQKYIDSLNCPIQINRKEKKTHEKETCVIKFQNKDELDSIIQEYQRTELLLFNRVFILPAKSYDLSCNFKEISLKPIEKKYILNLKIVKAKNISEAIKGAIITISKNNQSIVNQHRIENDRYQITELLKNDTLNIKCTKPGYSDYSETLKVEDLVKDINGNSIDYEIKLEDKSQTYFPHGTDNSRNLTGKTQPEVTNPNDNKNLKKLKITAYDENNQKLKEIVSVEVKKNGTTLKTFPKLLVACIPDFLDTDEVLIKANAKGYIEKEENFTISDKTANEDNEIEIKLVLIKQPIGNRKLFRSIGIALVVIAVFATIIYFALFNSEDFTKYYTDENRLLDSMTNEYCQKDWDWLKANYNDTVIGFFDKKALEYNNMKKENPDDFDMNKIDVETHKNNCEKHYKETLNDRIKDFINTDNRFDLSTAKELKVLAILYGIDTSSINQYFFFCQKVELAKQQFKQKNRETSWSEIRPYFQNDYLKDYKTLLSEEQINTLKVCDEILLKMNFSSYENIDEIINDIKVSSDNRKKYNNLKEQIGY